MSPIPVLASLSITAAWLLAGLLVRPRYRACARCGFLYDFDGRRCGHCKKGIGVGRRLLAALLWPLHLLRRVRELRALPPLHAMPGRVVPCGTSAVKAMRALPADPASGAPIHGEWGPGNAERALLGALLLDNSQINGVRSRVGKADFSDSRHATAFEAILRLHRQGKPVDLVRLRDALANEDLLGRAGGTIYLASHVEMVPSAAHAVDYAEVLISRRYPVKRIDAVLKGIFQHLERVHDGLAPSLPGLPTGLDELDQVIGGLQPGGLYVIAGRPSMGKTSLALAILEHLAIKLGKSALVFSPELSAEQLIRKLQGSMARVDPDLSRRGKLTEEEYGRLVMAAGALHEARIAIDERPGLDMTQLAECAWHHKPDGLDLVVVDPANLIQLRSVWTDVGGELKALAVGLGVPIVVTAPLHRRVEFRSGFRGRSSDLRDVGTLDAAADAVLLLYRDEYYDPDSKLRNYCEVNVARNRFGPESLVGLSFRRDWCRFENYTRLPEGGR